MGDGAVHGACCCCVLGVLLCSLWCCVDANNCAGRMSVCCCTCTMECFVVYRYATTPRKEDTETNPKRTRTKQLIYVHTNKMYTIL